MYMYMYSICEYICVYIYICMYKYTHTDILSFSSTQRYLGSPTHASPNFKLFAWILLFGWPLGMIRMVMSADNFPLAWGTSSFFRWFGEQSVGISEHHAWIRNVLALPESWWVLGPARTAARISWVEGLNLEELRWAQCLSTAGTARHPFPRQIR